VTASTPQVRVTQAADSEEFAELEFPVAGMDPEKGTELRAELSRRLAQRGWPGVADIVSTGDDAVVLQVRRVGDVAPSASGGRPSSIAVGPGELEETLRTILRGLRQHGWHRPMPDGVTEPTENEPLWCAPD
jgi:hypothetical protein